MFKPHGCLAMCIAFTSALIFFVDRTLETAGIAYIIGSMLSVACITSLFFLVENFEE